SSGPRGSTRRAIGFNSDDTEVSGLTYFHLAGEFIDEIRESDLGGIAHGGEFETSLLLHLRPDLVHEEKIAGTTHSKTYKGESKDLFDSGYHSVHQPFDAYTETGAVGQPELATEAKGAELFDRLGDAFRELVVSLHENNR
ncbi:MAG: creatininase family protein, partial [Halobacteriales archaeon]